MPWLCSLYLRWVHSYTLFWDPISHSLNLPVRGKMGPKYVDVRARRVSGGKKILGPEMKGRLLLKHLGAYRWGVSLFFDPFPRAGVWWLGVGAKGPICAC